MAKDMTEGSVLKTILTFATPILVGQILQMTYNLVDSIIVGRFIGEMRLASVAATYTTVTLFNALITGFTIGTSVIIAQFFGAKKFDDLRKTFSTTYICIFMAGILMAGVVFVAARPLLFYVLDTPLSILDDAVLYLRVYYSGALFVFMYNLLADSLRAMGDSLRPLWFLFISCVINIVLDLLFVVVFHWGVAGAAFATILAQAFACLAALLYVRRHYTIMWFKLGEIKFHRHYFGLALKLGIPEAFQKVVMSICFMWQQRLVNSFGPVTIAAFLAGQRVDQLLGMPIIVLGSAIAPFTGQNIGAGKMDRIFEGRKRLFTMSFLVCLVCAPILILIGRPLLSLFVADAQSEVITQAYQYLLCIVPFFFFQVFNSVTSGVMRGAGDVKYTTFLSFTSLFARIGAAYFMIYVLKMGYIGIWLSTGVGFAICVLPNFLRFRSRRWMAKAIVRPTPLQTGTEKTA